MKILWMVMLILGLAPVAAADNDGNLLVNSDFSQGKPGQESFVWRVELAEGEMNECTVVEGPLPGTSAVRIYNDERSSSGIDQKFAVRPWRWYVAEVWVKSDGMYPSVVGMSLKGGRKSGGWRYFMDLYHRPKSGWRMIRAYDHSGDSERLTLSIGGGAWSGELLLSEPVVHEISLVEAVGYHRLPGYHRNPARYGPSSDPAKGQYGYANQNDDVSRVARNFPNPFYISGRMDANAPEGRISLWLPAGIRFLKLRPHGGGKRPPEVTDLSGGVDARGGMYLELHTGPGEGQLLIESDLEPGERAIGYVYYEWKGGYQLPRPVVFEGVVLPKVTAPRRIVTALDVYGAAYLNWENFKPGLDGREAMVRDMKHLGFNRLQLWGGDPRPYATMGVEGASSYGGSFSVDAEKYPESVAVALNGERTKVMCPSYRGPGFKTNPWLERLRETASRTSAVNLDDELYLMSGVGPVICFDDRCMKRWKEWVDQHKPPLAGIPPKEFFKRAHKYPEHYEAWLRFRCDLVAERFGILRQVFHKAVEESGVKTTPEPELGAFTGEEMLVGLSSIEALSGALDFISPMIYLDGDGVRQEVAKIAPISGGKLVVCLAPGYLGSLPGDVRSQVLETVMGGARGFVAWNYDIGMTTGHLVDMAEAIRMLAPVEDIILDGELQTGYAADTESANLLARKQGDESVLLVSDYSPGGARVKVTVPGRASLEVVDLFSDQIVSRLDAEKRTFEVKLRRDFQARLYHLRQAGKS